jgi:tetratricopeptide (TPR) repeat protein
LITLNRLAQLFYNKGDCSRALSLHQECLAKRKRTLGDDHPETLASLNNLAGAFLKRGDYDRALPLFEECLTKQKRILGDDHPRTLAATHNFAGIIGSRGQFDRAVELLQENRDPHQLLRAVTRLDNHARSMHLPLGQFPGAYRLAAEMALHEESERQALDGDMAQLEQQWREAEVLAGIADNLLVPASVEARLTALRAEQRHRPAE